MFNPVLIIILAIGLDNSGIFAKKSESELIFANVLFRHGDRTPIDPYPTDPWNDLKYWPTGWGQLTNIGKMQHFELGKYLRNRYKNLISDRYDRNEVFIRSTDVDRTLMSAMSNLAGLYPPNGSQVWDPDLLWQPIPVHTAPEKQDPLLASKKYCEAYEDELQRVKASEEYRKINRNNAALYEYLTQESGRLVSSIEGVERLYNCMFIEELYNKTLPEWTRKVYPDKMIDLSAFNFATPTRTDLLKKLKSGPLLKEMLGHFKDKARGKLSPNRSLWIYSGHDTTVANLLNTLGAFKPHNPPYIACVMLELYKRGETYTVELYYRTEGVTNKLALPLCGRTCTLDRALESYSPLMPMDWERECRSTPRLLGLVGIDGDKADLFAAVGVVAGTVLAVTVLAIAVIAFNRWRAAGQRTTRHRYTRIDS